MSHEAMIFIWLGLTVVFSAIEAMTVGLTTIWFAIGSICAVAVALFGVENIPIQIAVFFVVSIVTLLITRPIAKKALKKDSEPTNADRNIGKIGVVITEIDPLGGTGEVKIGGIVWSAKAVGTEKIAVDEKVKVVDIEGVKLVVEKAE